MFNKSFWMCLLMLLGLITINSMFDLDQSYANGYAATSITTAEKNANDYISEAKFYGIPTFGLEARQESLGTSSEELEAAQGQFWGILIQ